jgi:hypothetical protein
MWNPTVYLNVTRSNYVIVGAETTSEAMCISIIPHTMGSAQSNTYEGLRVSWTT